LYQVVNILESEKLKQDYLTSTSSNDLVYKLIDWSLRQWQESMS